MPAKQRKMLVSAAPLKCYTGRQITDISYLENQLNPIKYDGIGVDNEEFVPGMGAAAVHVPSCRKPLDDLRQYIPLLKRAAATIVSFF